MPLLLLKDLPRYDCLLAAAQQFPALDPSACEVFLTLMRTGDEVFRVSDAYLQRHHLSQGRFTVLMLLLDKTTGRPHRRTPAELADLSGVTRATMTGLVDTLERDGMVVREPDPNDRRMMSVVLTTKGLDFITGLLPEHFRRVAALMSALSENERRTFVRLLNKVLAQTEIVEPRQRADAEDSSA